MQTEWGKSEGGKHVTSLVHHLEEVILSGQVRNSTAPSTPLTNTDRLRTDAKFCSATSNSLCCWVLREREVTKFHYPNWFLEGA